MLQSSLKARVYVTEVGKRSRPSNRASREQAKGPGKKTGFRAGVVNAFPGMNRLLAPDTSAPTGPDEALPSGGLQLKTRENVL